jgi:hypothetical protein
MLVVYLCNGLLCFLTARFDFAPVVSIRALRASIAYSTSGHSAHVSIA